MLYADSAYWLSSYPSLRTSRDPHNFTVFLESNHGLYLQWSLIAAEADSPARHKLEGNFRVIHGALIVY